MSVGNTHSSLSIVMNLAQQGLPCQVLNLRASHFRKLNMVGKFTQMHTLNLDFSSSLTSFRSDCFTCMPNLKILSLCETRVSNLWTTGAALSKLPSLVELRFQNYFYCNDTSSIPKPSKSKVDYPVDLGYLGLGHHDEASTFAVEETSYQHSSMDEESNGFGMNYLGNGMFEDLPVDIEAESSDNSERELSENSEVDFSSDHRSSSVVELLAEVPPAWGDLFDLQSEILLGTWEMQNEEQFFPSSSSSMDMSCATPKRIIPRHPSPICYEKHYREYIIASLPKLRCLDNLSIEDVDRQRANAIFSKNFEYLPYRRKNKESVVSILRKREIKANYTCISSRRQESSYSRNSQYFYSRSFSAAKVGSSAWPVLSPLSIEDSISRDERRSFRPRQFEYHPSNASLMVFGTLDGEVVVINHETAKIVSYVPSLGAMNSVLGLCWLKKFPSMVIAGSDNGSLRLYDIEHVPRTPGINCSAGSVIFDEFDQLTSVHVNSTDELFLASGYSKHVALYDISTGRRLQVFTDMHREHINVVKFSNHSPSIFATSSFDQDVKMWDLRQKPHLPCYTASSSRGNVMVCFSPDDHYLLVSAVDNEVRQLLAVDGRLHLNFGIASTGSPQNYTRSYYLNGRDYIISGSCDENIVRICCAQTGRRLRDVSLEGKGSGASMFVQSLRGDPFRDFHMSILATYIRPSSISEIVKEQAFCAQKCKSRCSKAGVLDRCMKYCELCCEKCKCVPSGTYGNKQQCPCYRDMRNSKGKPKCP